MELFGKIIVYIMMLCAIIGAFASIKNEESPLGKEFLEGIYSIGPIFVPTAGIMAAAPILAQIIKRVFGPIFAIIGSDPSMAATTFIAVDMGGYQLAYELASTKESWIMAMITGYMAGATIVFSIPVGLAMIKKKDHEYMALGIMSGILTIPIGVLISSLILMISNTTVREVISTDAQSTYQLAIGISQIFVNLIPLVIICALIAMGLWLTPQKMTKGFMIFGNVMDSALKIILVLSIVEYFTGIFSAILPIWGLEPIIADKVNQFRALETAGSIGIMLAGAFPMVYLIKKFFMKPLEVMGNKFGISGDVSAGVLAGAANILALFRMIEYMKPEDKVKTISFSVCAAFLLGDHLAFTANFQPNLILPVMIGKLMAGLIAIVIAQKIAVPRAIEINNRNEKLKGVC